MSCFGTFWCQIGRFFASEGGSCHRGFTIVLTKGEEKASCGETVVQKGVFGESVSFLPP